MAPPLTLVVLAAGLGRRYGGLKQVDPVGPGGEIILDYSVYDAMAAGFSRAVFVISPEIEDAFRARVAGTIARHCETACVLQKVEDLPPGVSVPGSRTRPWGTAHAVLCSRPAVKGPFAVINADDWYGPSSYVALAGRLSAGPDPSPRTGPHQYCMVGYRLDRTLSGHGAVARGVCEVSAAGTLAGVREHTRIEPGPGGPRFTDDGVTWHPLAPETIVSMNMWGFTPSLYDELEARFARFLAAHQQDIDTAEFFLPTVVTDMVAAGRARVSVLGSEETWHGVTWPGDRQRIREALLVKVAAGVYPARLWEGSA
jgi:hypothetical protein